MDGLVLFASALIAADCLLIVVDVSLRNLGMQPPAYTVALTEYSLLYMTMAAAPWLVRERGPGSWWKFSIGGPARPFGPKWTS